MPKTTTVAEMQCIRVRGKRNSRLTASVIMADFNRGHLKDISLSTVERILQNANLYGRITIRKPLLKP